MRGFGKICSAVEMIEDLLPWERRFLERQFFILVDPVPRDGDRRDLSIVSERAYLADYQVLWDGRNPNSA